MATATKVVGIGAGAAWCLLFVIMLVLVFAFDRSSVVTDVAFVGVPAIIAAAALWIAFGSGFKTEKLAFAIELLLFIAGATCLLIVAAASGG